VVELVVEVDAGAGGGEAGAGVVRAVFGVEAAAPDAAAYEPDVDVLRSDCGWLIAAPIIDGGGAGGSSDRSCSESSGSEMSSMGAGVRADEVDAWADT
jgi:hypothetical protein